MIKESYILSNGVEIPKIAAGSSAKNMEECAKAALGYGVRFLDTAYMYLSEIPIGNVLKNALSNNEIKREELFIQSKAPHIKAGYKVTLDEFYLSLKKLNLNYLDSYLIHYPQRYSENWRELVLDTWLAMEKLYNEGLIRAIGVSNFLPHHLDFLIKNANIKPMINQIELHPQHTQEHTVEYCKTHDIQLQAWAPLGAGRSFFNPLIQDLARKYNTSISKFVLNWHISQNIIPILGITGENDLQELDDFAPFEIKDCDIIKLKNLKDDYTNCHNDATLVDYIGAIPCASSSVDCGFVPYEKELKLFNFLPFYKIKYERGNKTKYYLFNIPIARENVKSLAPKTKKWSKKDKHSGKYEICPVFNDRNLFLECPVWDKKNKVIYCVASYNNRIYKINPKTREFKVIPTSFGVIGSIDVLSNGNIIAAENSGIYEIDPEKNKRTFLAQLKPENRYNFSQGDVCYNDGKLDKKGRFIVGTSSKYNNNKLYSFDGKSVKVLENNITVSNGLAWSKDNKYMYYTDSPTKKIARYVYNIETGSTYFDKYVIEIKDGTPDGMTIDEEDNLWIALFEGQKVVKYETKDYTRIDEIKFPVYTTSCCIGDGYLYITTCQENGITKSSGLFRVKLDKSPKTLVALRERERERERVILYRDLIRLKKRHNVQLKTNCTIFAVKKYKKAS